MVGNFMVREISRGARKLTRTPTLIKKKKKIVVNYSWSHFNANLTYLSYGTHLSKKYKPKVYESY
jgi:hypothetical protein